MSFLNTIARVLIARALVLLLVTVGGCSKPKAGDVVVDKECEISRQDAEPAKQCLVDCARAGNPMSDEEGEDLVAACESACRDIYCTPVFLVFDKGQPRRCRPGLDGQYVEACKQAGWKEK